MSYVIFEKCGRFFEMWGMPFLTRGKSAIVSDCENIIAVQGSEDFNNGKACIVLREAWLGGPLPSGAACRIRKCAKGYAILISCRLTAR